MFNVDELKRQNPIEEVVQHFDEFKISRHGRTWRGIVHNSFVVNENTGLYYWNKHNRGGDVISFLENECGMDFMGAVRWLADRAGYRSRCRKLLLNE